MTMTVSEVMNRIVWSAKPHASLQEVVELMRDHACGWIPIVEKNSRRVVGVVTDRDAVLAAARLRRRLGRIAVEDVMTREVVVCRPGDTIDRAQELMGDRRVRRLPVVDEQGELVGILALDDLARLVARLRRSEVEGTNEHDLAALMIDLVGRVKLPEGLSAFHARL